MQVEVVLDYKTVGMDSKVYNQLVISPTICQLTRNHKHLV